MKLSAVCLLSLFAFLIVSGCTVCPPRADGDRQDWVFHHVGRSER